MGFALIGGIIFYFVGQRLLSD